MYPILVVIIYSQISIFTLTPPPPFFFSLAGYSTTGFTCDMFSLVPITSGKGKCSLATQGVSAVVATGVPALMVGGHLRIRIGTPHRMCVRFKIRGLVEMAAGVCTSHATSDTHSARSQPVGVGGGGGWGGGWVVASGL